MILFTLLVILFVFVCIFLCFLILIQSDKGGGISGALGGGMAGANNLLGTRDTANILTRATTISAFIFMGLCILLSLFLSNPAETQEKSLLQERAEKQQQFSPSSALSQQQQLPLVDEAQEIPQGEPAAGQDE